MPSWFSRAVLTAAVVIVSVLAALWIVGRLRGLLFMLFVALFVAVALEPAVQALVRRGWKRGRATVLVFSAAAILTLGFFAAVVPLFITQAIQIANNFPTYVDELQRFVGRFVNADIFFERLRMELSDVGRLLQRYGADIAGGVLGVGGAVFNFLFQAVTVTLFSFYMVAEGPRMRNTILSALNPHRQREVMRVWEIAVAKTGGYFYSRAILALVSAIFHSIAFSVLGLPGSVGLGIWVGVLSQFVPVVGTYVAGVVPVLLALFQSPIKALIVLAIILGYQQLENFLIMPRITQRTMSMHPAVAIASLIAGTSLLGGVGTVLALPVAATIQAFVSTLIRRHELVAEEAVDGESER